MLAQSSYPEVFGKIGANPDRLRPRFQNWIADPEPTIANFRAQNPDLTRLDRTSTGDIASAWNRSGSPKTLADWLDSYARVRINQGRGSDFEINALDWLDDNLPGWSADDVKHLFTAPDDTDFIPDGSAWFPFDQPAPGGIGPERGYHIFTEVKRYEATILQPSSNVGKQLQYLIRYPPASSDAGHQFVLMVGPQTRISPSMLSAIQDAVREGVVVRIYRALDASGDRFVLVQPDELL